MRRHLRAEQGAGGGEWPGQMGWQRPEEPPDRLGVGPLLSGFLIEDLCFCLSLRGHMCPQSTVHVGEAPASTPLRSLPLAALGRKSWGLTTSRQEMQATSSHHCRR